MVKTDLTRETKSTPFAKRDTDREEAAFFFNSLSTFLAVEHVCFLFSFFFSENANLFAFFFFFHFLIIIFFRSNTQASRNQFK